MTMLPFPWRAAVAASLLAALGMASVGAVEPATASLAEFLATWKLARADRSALEEPGPWSDDKLQVCMRVLARLALAPPAAFSTWTEKAAPADATTAPGDVLVRFAGRAVRVAPITLSAAQAEIANRATIDLVRVQTATGPVDVIADAVPRAWPRWTPIDEPVSLVGLPVSVAPGPNPEPPAGTASAAPAAAAGLLVLARRVAWHPDTPLGALGMDYGLFDTVADGQRLVAGDTDAFYAMLAAVGRETRSDAERPAATATDVIPLIDPARGWFTKHRGEPVSFQGTARRATRIQIDEPRRRREVGGDHYWELFVFVPTSLIKVNDRLQETYPIVCCVRDLPAGMPTGQVINEQVRVSGFAMKRYAYPLPKVQGREAEGQDRQETALVIGERAVWVPEPSAAGATSLLGWAFLALAGVVGLLLAFGAWRFNRDARRERQRQRSALPDRLDLP